MKPGFSLGVGAATLLLLLPGQALAQATASDHMVATRYDKSRRVVGVVSPDPDGAGPIRFAATRNTYNAQGQLTKIETGELANWPGDNAPATWESFGFSIFRIVDNLYDASGRKIRETVSAGGATTSVLQTSYNAAGQPVCVAVRMNPATFGSLPTDACTLSTPGTHGPDRITRTVYDAGGRVATVQKAYGTSLQQDYVSYTYTPNEKQATVTDANGATARYVYDGLDRLSRWYFPSKTSGGVSSDTDFEEYGYDAADNRVSLRKRDGQLLGYSYDSLGRVVMKDIPGTSAKDVFYGYDNRGLQVFARFGSSSGEGISDEYDGAGRQTKTTNTMAGGNLIIQRTYDANGNRTRVTHPDSNYFTYEYDGLDRPITVRENGATALASFAYNARAERVSDTRSVGVVGYVYDAMSRPTTVTLSGTTANLTSGYDYNPASQVVFRTRSNSTYVYGQEQNLTRHHTANGLNQYLTAGNPDVTGGVTAYEYDANGNFRSDGSVLLSYDSENRLISSTGARVAMLTYDPLGRLWQTGDEASTTRFLYDGDDLIEEYNGAGGLSKRYVHGAITDNPIVAYDGMAVSAIARRQLFSDHQGSVVAQVDDSGAALVNRYDDWGIPDTGDQGRFQYTGQIWLPELRMYYYKARIYSPTLGRFLQTDPIGYEDQVNLYAYVANDPINQVDPSGMECGSLIPGRVGAACSGGSTIGIEGEWAALANARANAAAAAAGPGNMPGGRGGRERKVPLSPSSEVFRRDKVRTIIVDEASVARIIQKHGTFTRKKSSIYSAWTMSPGALTFILNPIIQSGRTRLVYGGPQIAITGRTPWPIGDVPGRGDLPRVIGSNWGEAVIEPTGTPGVYRLVSAYAVQPLREIK